MNLVLDSFSINLRDFRESCTPGVFNWFCPRDHHSDQKVIRGPLMCLRARACACVCASMRVCVWREGRRVSVISGHGEVHIACLFYVFLIVFSFSFFTLFPCIL